MTVLAGVNARMTSHWAEAGRSFPGLHRSSADPPPCFLGGAATQLEDTFSQFLVNFWLQSMAKITAIGHYANGLQDTRGPVNEL